MPAASKKSKLVLDCVLIEPIDPQASKSPKSKTHLTRSRSGVTPKKVAEKPKSIVAPRSTTGRGRSPGRPKSGTSLLESSISISRKADPKPVLSASTSRGHSSSSSQIGPALLAEAINEAHKATPATTPKRKRTSTSIIAAAATKKRRLSPSSSTLSILSKPRTTKEQNADNPIAKASTSKATLPSPDPSVDSEHDLDPVLEDFQLLELDDTVPWSIVTSYYGDDQQRDILAPPKVQLMLENMRRELARQAMALRDSEASVLKMTQEIEALRAENQELRTKRQDIEDDYKELQSEHDMLKQQTKRNQGPF